MANSHMEIHDSSSNHHNIPTRWNCDPKTTSYSDSMAGTMELRLIMTYSKRRTPKKDKGSPIGDIPVTLNADTISKGLSPVKVKVTKKKKKTRAKGLSGLMSCVKPQVKNEMAPQSPAMSSVQNRCLVVAADSSDSFHEEDEVENMVNYLTEIADEIPFTPPELQSDSKDDCSEDAVEKVIALLLREAGDKLNEEELKKAGIAKELFWNYSFFETVMKTLLTRMGLRTSEPNALGPQAPPQTQIAVACEVTSRLSALDTLPMSRMLDHGARYLQVHYSSWAHLQGGYEQALSRDDEDEVQ
ncbi:apoptosis facilitator Bcl-2-like protein 14 isoform X2 [Antennarius striatus]|uniref:apoptosis facilitator Bcl-2-like protein 14 isoform X2 n=1 Tax=Antennarius striatus TaxID=241820 RepID=UPI0035AF1674